MGILRRRHWLTQIYLISNLRGCCRLKLSRRKLSYCDNLTVRICASYIFNAFRKA